MHARIAPLIAVLALLAIAAPAAALPAGSKTVTSGTLSATLSWQAGQADDTIEGSSPRLRIDRAGVTVLDADLTRQCQLCIGVYGPEDALKIRDLDADGEPEVLVDMFSGGAHCCATTLIWYLKDGAYTRKVASWGNPGYRLRDLDKDGRPELYSADDRFNYTFTAYAFSWPPPLILRFDRGTLTDVTRRYPRSIRSDMSGILKTLPSARKSGDPRGLVAAYAADLCLLGKVREAHAYVARAVRRGDVDGEPKGDTIWPSGKRFPGKLFAFLKRSGYCA